MKWFVRVLCICVIAIYPLMLLYGIGHVYTCVHLSAVLDPGHLSTVLDLGHLSAVLDRSTYAVAEVPVHIPVTRSVSSDEAMADDLAMQVHHQLTMRSVPVVAINSHHFSHLSPACVCIDVQQTSSSLQKALLQSTLLM